MEKFLWLSSFLLVSNGNGVVNSAPLVVADKHVGVSEEKDQEQSSCFVQQANAIPTESERCPYIQSRSGEMVPSRKPVNGRRVIMIEKKLRVRQKFSKVLPYRPICRGERKSLAVVTPASRQVVKPIRLNEVQTPLKICHARKFNRSFLRQRYLGE